MVATRVVCARFGGEDGRRLGGELAHGLRGWAELRRLYRGSYPLPSPPPLRASPCRGGGSSAVVWHFGCFLLLGMNGRSTRVVCFSSVGKQANPTPALPRCGLRPAGEGGVRREIEQWLVNGLRVWWAFPVVGGGASPTLRVYISIGGCIANATPSPTLPRYGLRPAGEGAERLRECGRLMCVRNGAPRRTLWWFVGLRAAR